MNPYLPAFFSFIEQPRLLPLADCQLHMARFDSSLIEPDDYLNCDLTPISGAEKRQAEHLAGRLCARKALKDLGAHATPSRGEQGQPIWPVGFVGTISHSQGYAAALVGQSHHWQALGLDLEGLISPERAHRLAKTVLTPVELEVAANLSDEQFAERLRQTFSLKESLFKALFPLVNKRFYFQHAEALELGAGKALLRLNLDLSPQWRCGSLISGYYEHFHEMLVSAVAIPANTQQSVP